MFTYNYTKNDYNFIQLLDEVYSAITKQLYAIEEGDLTDGYAESNGNQLYFMMNDSLTGPEEITLSATVVSHSPNQNYTNHSINHVNFSEKNVITKAVTSTTINSTSFFSGGTSLETVIRSIINSYSFSGGGGNLLPAFTESYESNKTYIGYGILNACKISRLISSGNTYENLWAEGEETLDKIWSARTSYSYF